MSLSPLALTPLSEHCGAEIEGLDLTSLTEAQLQALRTVVAERGVALVLGQNLTPAQHIALARRWGEIDVNRFFPADARYPEIAEVGKTETQVTNIGGGWHTDHSYDPVPAMGSILVARELPPTGGDTLFASLYAAYDSLSDGLKATLQGLRAVHSADHVYGPDGAYRKTDMSDQLGGQDKRTLAIHPVVVTHPDSGRKVLYVNPAFTLRFEGWTREESLPLLNHLYAQAIRPEHVCALKWRPGSVAIWDNRATWHFAKNDYQGHRRLMHRITLSGVPLH